MVTYTTYPVIVDGVRLDSAAWGIDVKTRATAETRVGDTQVNGIDGMIASLNDDLGVASRTYSMWLLGTDANGVIPGGSDPMAQCLANADTLTHLFKAESYRLRDVREVVDASGTQRQFYAKVTDSLPIDIKAGGYGRFTVTLSIPAGSSQDVATSDWTSTPTIVSGNAYQVTTLAGATAPIGDAIITVTGPANNPQVSDYVSGAYVKLNRVLAAGEVWRINSGTWATRYGSGLTLGSTDSAGTDGWPITQRGGGNARLLTLQPSLLGGSRVVQVALTAAGITSATTVAVRARRRFLL